MLITLAIIGIIAALTVPTLMRKYQEHQTVVAVKEAYSILSNAYKMAVEKNGPSSTWLTKEGGDYMPTNHIKTMNYFTPYLKLANYDSANCVSDYVNYYSSRIKTLDGGNASGVEINHIRNNCVKLQNGMFLFFFGEGLTPTMYVNIDINGTNPPNTFGKDVFLFAIKDNILYPGGTPAYASVAPQSNYCNKNVKQANNGKYCTYWVIYKGNMDYLRRDVSAEW